MIDTVYLDLDDTLNNFTAEAVYALGGKVNNVTDYDKNDICGACGITPMTLYSLMGRMDFWNSLQMTQKGWAIRNALAQFDIDVIVVTCVPAHSKEVTSEYVDKARRAALIAKSQWLAAHGFESWAIVTEKWKLAGPGKLLIDDNPHRTGKFEDAGGYAIVVPQPWNTELRDPVEQIIKFLTPNTLTFGDEFVLTPDPASDMIDTWMDRTHNHKQERRKDT